MIDEIELARRMSDGSIAKGLLDNDILRKAFFDLETAYIAAWRATDIRDTDARERLFLAVNQVSKIRDHLRIVMDNGKIAQRDLEQITKPKAA